MIVQAARQAQSIRLGELKYAGEFIESTQHLYPEIAGEVMNIYTEGASPKYTPLPKKEGPGDGYPHSVENTARITESMLGDVEGLNAILRNTDRLPPPQNGYRVEPSATGREPFQIYGGPTWG